MEYKEQIEKLRKLKELAERGVDGEREAARGLLKKLLAKYKLTISELAEEEVRWFEFKYKDAAQKQIISGCIHWFELDSYTLKRDGRTLKVVGVNCTPNTYTELRPFIEWHLRNLAKEQAAIADAYQIKHQLWSPEPCEPSEGKKMSVKEMEELRKRVAALGDGKYQAPLKRIGEEGNGDE